MQSTNEELETSKEELQSLNEELTALNSQLSETIEHQRATSNDLRNTMNSSEIAMLFLDGNLKIRLFTPAASTMFNIIDSDIGRPLADLARRINDPQLLTDAGGVLGGRISPNREVEADSGAWYTRRIVPYRDQDDKVEGVVITFTDISEGKAAERAIEAARSYSESIINTIHQPLVVLDADLRVISASRSFYDTFSAAPEATVGRHLHAVERGSPGQCGAARLRRPPRAWRAGHRGLSNRRRTAGAGATVAARERAGDSRTRSRADAKSW